MKLSKESQYGLTGMLYLATRPPGAVVSAAETAQVTGVSFAFLAKIFNRLARGGVLRAHRGRSRGYSLARPAEELTVRTIIETIEGPTVFRHCVFWSNTCSETNPCPMHEVWLQVRPRVAKLMEETSLADLARNRAERGENGAAALDAGLAADSPAA